MSAIADWQTKNSSAKIEEADLFVKEIYVDGGRMLKRMRPAPQGRGYRVRKRSNHVTLVVDSLVAPELLYKKEDKAEVIDEKPKADKKAKAPAAKATEKKAEAKKTTKKTDNK